MSFGFPTLGESRLIHRRKPFFEPFDARRAKPAHTVDRLIDCILTKPGLRHIELVMRIPPIWVTQIAVHLIEDGQH
jgi:hypothetical protein